MFGSSYGRTSHAADVEQDTQLWLTFRRGLYNGDRRLRAGITFGQHPHYIISSAELRKGESAIGSGLCGGEFGVVL